MRHKFTFKKFPLDSNYGGWECSYYSVPMSVMLFYQHKTRIIGFRRWMWKIPLISLPHSKLKCRMLMYLFCIEINFRTSSLAYRGPLLLCHWLWTVNLRWTYCQLTTPLNTSNRIRWSLNPFQRVTNRHDIELFHKTLTIWRNLFSGSLNLLTMVTLSTLSCLLWLSDQSQISTFVITNRHEN